MPRLRIVFSLIAGLIATVQAEDLFITVQAGPHDREGTPLVAELPMELQRDDAKGILLIPQDQQGATAVAGQILPGERTRVVWMLERPLASGESRPYRVDLVDKPADQEKNDMHVEETAESISLGSGDRPILRYLKKPTADAARNEPVYTRSGYIHPLLTPSGRSVTGDYPEDHPHQHALFGAWTKTTFEGREINFWDQKSGKARVAHASTSKILSGPVLGQFVVKLVHEDLSDPDSPKPVLDETWVVRAYRTGGNYHLIDIKSSQRCATESPLNIQQYHYGGMAIRGPSNWFDADKKAVPPAGFLTSEGLTRLDGNHSRPHWVAMHGALDGQTAGVAMLSHPGNFRAPQWVRLHPTKPYFVFTPMVEEGFSITPAAPYVSQYRYVVFDGEPDPKLLQRIWTAYATPPEILVEKKKS